MFPPMQAEEADILPYLERVTDPALKHSLRWGTAGPDLRCVHWRHGSHVMQSMMVFPAETQPKPLPGFPALQLRRGFLA